MNIKENNQLKYKINRSRLVGTVHLSGAKNSALKLLTASLLTDGTLELFNHPSQISDACIHVEMLEKLGKKCLVKNDYIKISESEHILSHLAWDGRSIRNTLLILGALVARTGHGAVPLPGGCKIGERKHDLHIMVLQSLGAEVWEEKGMLMAQRKKARLKGADIYLPIRSTGATENAILCGCLAEGTTTVWNPHIRPEVLDLIDMLRSMGAKIAVFGLERICIEGVERLSGAKHSVIPDNMEALTWVIGSVVTGGDVEIMDFPYNHLEVPLVFLRESGAQFYKREQSLIVRGGSCYPFDISTGSYPGINSDMQPLFAVYGFCAQGVSNIIDLRFPGRYDYVREIGKMGGKYKIEGEFLHIYGNKTLQASDVIATDLRAGAALALAGLVANGETVIQDAWQIERGYNRFFDKIVSLGADIACQ
jgi:UDP-N-acetylglucosamine 1-carboxyvinyltransferase